MDVKTVATVFAAVCRAALGHKPLLGVISGGAGGPPPLAVLLGGSLALIASTLMAVVFGEALLRVVRPEYLQLGAAVVFLVVGVLVGVEALRGLRG